MCIHLQRHQWIFPVLLALTMLININNDIVIWLDVTYDEYFYQSRRIYSITLSTCSTLRHVPVAAAKFWSSALKTTKKINFLNKFRRHRFSYKLRPSSCYVQKQQICHPRGVYSRATYRFGVCSCLLSLIHQYSWASFSNALTTKRVHRSCYYCLLLHLLVVFEYLSHLLDLYGKYNHDMMPLSLISWRLEMLVTRLHF